MSALAPLTAAVVLAAAPAPGEPTWCQVDYDAEQASIVLAYSGEGPRFTTHADASGFRLEATFEDGASRRFQFGDDLPRRAPFARWNLKRVDGRATLSVVLARPLGLLLAEDAEKRTVVMAVVGGRSPRVAPAPSAAGPSWRLSPSLWFGQYQEDYLAGDVQLQSPLTLPGLALDWRLPAASGPAWQGRLAFATSSLAFRDRSFPLSTHTRQAYAAETLVGPELAWGPMSLEAGLGYWARLEQTVHSAVPPTPTYAFAAERWLHGPQLGATAGWTLLGEASALGGWRLVAEGVGQPVVFSRLDAGVAPLPALFGGRVAIGLEGRFAGHQLTLSFQRRMLGSFGGYAEVVQGPSLSFR